MSTQFRPTRREFLLGEEQRLCAALSSVRTGLNDLTAISLLPIEILEEIFGICVSWLYGHQKPKYRLAWTQVCRTWRRISLNSARLWRCIDLCDSRLAHEFLIRSGTAPISIVSASPLKLCTDTLQLHANRLQSIDVFLFPEDMVELFASIGPDLSNLTNLSLKIPPVSTNINLDIDVPKITRLSLDCVAIPWDACHHLTHLSLRGLPTQYAPSFHQLHSILKSSPNIEYLRLESIAPALPDDLPRELPVSLPQLRELIVSGKSPLISSLLSSLVLSSTTRIQLHCSTFDNLHGLLPPNDHWQRPDIGTLRLARRAIIFLRPGAAPWSDNPSDSLVSISSSSSVSNSTLASIGAVIDPQRIQVLELCTGVLAEIPPEPIANFLAQTINLNTLRVTSNNLDSLFRALSSSSPSVLCPHLTGISFSKPGEVWWHFHQQWLEPLSNLVKARMALSIPLRTLTFKQCHGVSPLTMEAFSGIVSEINVSEHVGTEQPRRPLHG